MFKAIGRQFQKKQDYHISVKLTKITCQVEEDCQVSVIWQRGPDTQESALIDLNGSDVETDLSETFERVSHFYSKDGGETFEAKMCNFKIKLSDGDEGKEIGV